MIHRTMGAIALTLSFLLGSVPAAALPAFAASGDTLPTAQITVEQAPVFGVTWKWTLLNTNNETFTGNKESEQLNIPAGSYTLFLDSPKGYNTLVEMFQGETLLKTSESPQIHFQFDGSLPIRFKVTFTLFYKGKVNVVTTPQGIPFELRGPNQIVIKGITPQTYADMPIGQYSVRYLPQGCATTPPPRSDELKYEGRIDLYASLKCSGLQADVLQSSEEKKVEKQATETVKEEVKAEETEEVAPAVETSTSLSDVPSDAWFSPFVTDVVKRGIMAGYKNDDGTPSATFGPDDPLSLAQLAKIAHEISGLDESLTTSEPVNLSAYGWMLRYIASAEANDWIVYFDTDTDVNRQATRGEVLVTLLQSLDIPLKWPKGKMFTDVSRRTPYAGAIETAADAGIVAGTLDAEGKPTGKFDPLSSVNRAQMAKMIMMTIEKYQLNVQLVP